VSVPSEPDCSSLYNVKQLAGGADATAQLRNGACCQWVRPSHNGPEMSQKENKGSNEKTPPLPPNGEGRIYGGHGQGNPCALCGAPIDPTQIEYEVEWQDAAGPRRSHFHLACYEQLRSDSKE
jgi:hypothetical protein